jgi:predicted DNA-binding transcriptional regulator YafY
LAPTHEFVREILSNGPAVEVLHPQSLRDEIMDKVEKMRNSYKK